MSVQNQVHLVSRPLILYVFSYLCIFLAHHWVRHQMVPKSGRLLVKAFDTGHGVTKGEPASPTIFNILVNVVVRAVLEEVYGPQESKFGLGWAVGEQNIVFYRYDGRIAGRDHI